MINKQQASQEGRVPELGLARVVELARQGFSGGAQAQVGERPRS